MGIAEEDYHILKKTSQLQSCLMHGKKLKVLLYKSRNFYLDESGADIINIWMHKQNDLNVEYILEKGRSFTRLLKKYRPHEKNIKWGSFIINSLNYFKFTYKENNINELYKVFKDVFLKKDFIRFMLDELHIKHMVILPIYNYNNKEKIGHVTFIFQSPSEVDMKKLEAIKTSFQVILQPLYNIEHHLLYTKLVQTDEEMALLTQQEKKIVRQVLRGRSYPDIAANLYISINTLKTHIKNIFNKYNVSSKIELYKKFNENSP